MQTEQQQLRAEIVQLRSDVGRVEAAAAAAAAAAAQASQASQASQAKPQWLTGVESALTLGFERQHKKMDEVNGPARAQQVCRLFAQFNAPWK